MIFLDNNPFGTTALIAYLGCFTSAILIIYAAYFASNVSKLGRNLMLIRKIHDQLQQLAQASDTIPREHSKVDGTKPLGDDWISAVSVIEENPSSDTESGSEEIESRQLQAPEASRISEPGYEDSEPSPESQTVALGISPESAPSIETEIITHEPVIVPTDSDSGSPTPPIVDPDYGPQPSSPAIRVENPTLEGLDVSTDASLSGEASQIGETPPYSDSASEETSAMDYEAADEPFVLIGDPAPALEIPDEITTQDDNPIPESDARGQILMNFLLEPMPRKVPASSHGSKTIKKPKEKPKSSSIVKVYALQASRHKLTIRGTSPLSWDKGEAMHESDLGQFDYLVPPFSGTLRIRFFIDDRIPCSEPWFEVEAGSTIECYPDFGDA